MLVISADTLVRVRNGRILVHTTSSPLPAFESNHAMLIGWICRFATPADPDAAIAALPLIQRKGASEVVDYLTRSGVLVPADAPDARERSAADAAKLARNHLRQLARSVYDLACDVIGLGPEVSEAALTERTGIGLERRLLAALASLDALRKELLPARGIRIREQLAGLGIGPASRDLRLHIGCGTGHLQGWVNIDVHPAPLSLNVLLGLPVPDGSVGRVFISHMLEHLFYPLDVRRLFAELRRVMAPGAVLRIAVPDIEQCIEAYVANDRRFYAGRRETWDWWPENATRLEDFLAYAGAGAEPAYLFEAHKFGYDYETLAKTLGEAGFDHVRRSAYMASEDPAMRVDDVSAVAKAQYGGRHYSLFVEARAPAG